MQVDQEFVDQAKEWLGRQFQPPGRSPIIPEQLASLLQLISRIAYEAGEKEGRRLGELAGRLSERQEIADILRASEIFDAPSEEHASFAIAALSQAAGSLERGDHLRGG